MDKEKLQEVALSYVGTPHINGAHVKGAGVDCSTLPAMIFEEMGMGKFEIKYNYSSIWYLQSNCKELLLPYLERYCVPIERKELREGDIIAYQWGRAVSHLAIVYDLAKGWVIHSHVDNGVEIVEMDAPYFIQKNGKSREHSYWRLKGE